MGFVVVYLDDSVKSGYGKIFGKKRKGVLVGVFGVRFVWFFLGR